MSIELKEVGLDIDERRVGRLIKINSIRSVRSRPQSKIGGQYQLYVANEGWLWLASKRLDDQNLAFWAFSMAVHLRAPTPGSIFHSDRGSQYCSHDFPKKLTEKKMISSISDKRNYFNNATAKTFFKT
ncbi:hypothetical protein [Gluconobacter kanchanaburiensis]|uniref:hypothetical protein n=1 Tax=Gluconobacter kanchanaburiensis TaxID=563199 RepID=UPI0011BF40A2|nr:hypothetical protein [Gluconobacter kanchanaburiensis]MBF0862239.1 hypothetical protein [Gluconobacter kanchanaburiensis]